MLSTNQLLALEFMYSNTFWKDALGFTNPITCKIFSLVPFITFQFLMIEFTIIPKNAIWHLAIWQNWYFSQFYHSKIENETLSLLQFSLVTGFFEGTRENILHTFRALVFFTFMVS